MGWGKKRRYCEGKRNKGKGIGERGKWDRGTRENGDRKKSGNTHLRFDKKHLPRKNGRQPFLLATT